MKVKTSLCTYPAKLYEGRNNPLHLFGQLNSNHRLDLLAIHLHSSVGETKCGAYSRSLSLRFSEL